MAERRRGDVGEHLARVARAMGEPEQPAALFAALDRATAAVIGHTLFTLMVWHAASSETERVYSNQPAPYPVGGRKHFADTPWSRHLLREGRPYVGRTRADIRESFPDHELIFSLGCASVLNVPVVWRGRVLGTMNLLHEEGWYGDDDVPRGQAFAALLVPAYLA